MALSARTGPADSGRASGTIPTPADPDEDRHDRAAPPKVWTTDDLLLFPKDNIDRWIIGGKLREKPMTRRNRFHAKTEARIALLLGNWLLRQPKPRGEVHSGEIGCILRRDPETSVGIDVAYFSADVVAAQTKATTMMDGVPTVAVEILSPSDTQDETDEKVGAYLSASVAHVWVVNTRYRTVTVYRPGVPPVLRNETDDLTAEPELPGFAVPVAEVFGD